MSCQVPPWVRDACKLWGRQKRRIWSGGLDVYDASAQATKPEEKRRDVDGYTCSLLGRLKDERSAGGAAAQHWPEVFWGAGLDVQRVVVVGMPESFSRVLHLHYVFDPEFRLSCRSKAGYARLEPPRYWDVLRLSETWVWARLDPLGSRLENSEAYVLPSPKIRAIRRKVPSLSLAALYRSRLTLKS